MKKLSVQAKTRLKQIIVTLLYGSVTSNLEVILNNICISNAKVYSRIPSTTTVNFSYKGNEYIHSGTTNTVVNYHLHHSLVPRLESYLKEKESFDEESKDVILYITKALNHCESINDLWFVFPNELLKQMVLTPKEENTECSPLTLGFINNPENQKGLTELKTQLLLKVIEGDNDGVLL